MLGILRDDIGEKFRNDTNVLGADGTTSIRISPTRVVIAMGDTFKGNPPYMAGNCLGVQNNGGDVAYRFSTSGGAFFSKPCGADVFWPTSWFWRGALLYIGGAAYNYAGAVGGFAQRMFPLVRYVTNPTADPAQWQYSGALWPSGPIQNSGFDSCFLLDAATLWAYGFKEIGGAGHNYPILARTPLQNFDEGAPNWTYWSGGATFSAFASDAEPMWDDEFSGNNYRVHYDAGISRWVATYVPDIFAGWVRMRFAEYAWGPWSDSVDVFRPDGFPASGARAYEPKKHPVYGTNIYSVNVNRPGEYWPVFFEVSAGTVFKSL